jgi:CRISPR-associated protein Cas2
MPRNRKYHEPLIINSYKIMWLFVFFDLPVINKADRKAAALFRKNIMQDGFHMMQYSVYNRHCASEESAQVHIKRVQKLIPSKGAVSILKVTDKQFGDILNFHGKTHKPSPNTPTQLELF